MIITGDFNFPHINWSTGSSNITDNLTESFCNILDDHFLMQMNSHVTHKSSSSSITGNILDLVFTNFESLVEDSYYHYHYIIIIIVVVVVIISISIIWLALRAGKMEPSCSLGITCCIPQENNKSFIDQVCLQNIDSTLIPMADMTKTK